MKRIDRLYKNAQHKIGTIEARKRFEENIKEIEDYTEYRKTHPMTEKEKEDLQCFIAEMEACYG